MASFLLPAGAPAPLPAPAAAGPAPRPVAAGPTPHHAEQAPGDAPWATVAATAGFAAGAAAGAARRRRQRREPRVGVGAWGSGETVTTDVQPLWEETVEKLQISRSGRELEETATDRVFHWLGKSPEVGSPCFKALQRHFPGAMPAKVVHNRTRTVLEQELGFKPETTLLGSSFCPDEINNQGRDLPTVMRDYYGSVFPMGGLGGVPYVGETGFAAFSSHVAENGDIIVVFGPHTSISIDGEVGKHLREGQSCCSGSCGAVTGAYNSLVSGSGGTPDWDDSDMQMSEIKQEFAAHVDKLSQTECPMASCTYQAWEMVKDRMLKIVNTKFGGGRLVLIGGIILNLPDDYPSMDDHFLPLMFEVRQEGEETIDMMGKFSNVSIQQDLQRSPWAAIGAQREVFSWMTWSPPADTALYQALHKYFPGALPAEAVHRRAIRVLEKYGFTQEKTLLGTSFCPDEINNESDCLGVIMQEHWGEVFPMGGLGGAPFTGKTGFAAFSSHVADEGHILVAFGPHAGISEDGEVGQVLRKGQSCCSAACGAVTGAYKACCMGWTDSTATDESGYDLQMDYIKRWVSPHVEAISRTENPMAALTHQSYQMVKDVMFQSVNTNFGDGYLCLLGGITLNLGPNYPDHFYPVTFELRREGHDTIDLMNEMREIH